MPIATRSMATRSMARTESDESLETPKPAAGRGRGKGKKNAAAGRVVEPIASTSTASAGSVPDSPYRKPPPVKVTKKMTKSKPAAAKVTISISSDEEEENKKAEEVPKEKFAVPKSRPLKPKKAASATSSSKTIIKDPVIEADTESSGDDVGRLTRSSARSRAKGVIASVKEVPQQKEQIPEIKTTKRNANKRILEPRNEIASPLPSNSSKDLSKNKGQKKETKKRGRPVKLKEEVQVDTDDDDLFEIVRVPASKTHVAKALGTKPKDEKNANLKIQADMEDLKEEQDQSVEILKGGTGGRKLRNHQLPSWVKTLEDIEPGVFASQCRTISSVMLDPVAVRGMNYHMNEFQHFRDEIVESSQQVLKKFIQKKKAEQDAKNENEGKGASVPKNQENEVVQEDPSVMKDSRVSEDMFSSFSFNASETEAEKPQNDENKIVPNQSKPERSSSSSPINTGAKKSSIESETVSGYLSEIKELPTKPVSIKTDSTSKAVHIIKYVNKNMGVKRARSEEEIQEQEQVVDTVGQVPLNFNFQASAEKEHENQPTKKFILDAGANFQPGPSSLPTMDELVKLLPSASADATFIKLPEAKKPAGDHITQLNLTFDKDFNSSVEGLTDDGETVPSASDDTDEDKGNDDSVFENSNVEAEIEEIPTRPAVQLDLRKPLLNETVCISNPKFPHLSSLPIPETSVAWAASVSTLEILEEEEEIVVVPKDRKTKPDKVLKDKVDHRSAHSNSSSSSASSTGSFKSATSQLSFSTKAPVKVPVFSTKLNDLGKVKLDYNKKNAFEREEEAKRKKAELLQQKTEIQKKKNEEWKKKAEKMKLDEELKKAKKDPIPSKSKPVLKFPKTFGNPFSFKPLEYPSFKPSGPMNYKSPKAHTVPIKSLFLASETVKAPEIPIRSIPKDDSFKTPSNSFLDTTADMTINSYDITIYEDLDDDLKHRENKHVPEWAQNKQGVTSTLFRMVPFRDYYICKPNFPRVQRGFKLYGGVHRE